MSEHTITITASGKMDAAGLVTAVCSCGQYRSAPTTAERAASAGRAHTDNPGGITARGGVETRAATLDPLPPPGGTP